MIQTNFVFRILFSKESTKKLIMALLLLVVSVPIFAQTLTSVRGNTVTLNVGSRDGVKKGMTAFVLKDEGVSGQIIPRQIAKIKIINVKTYTSTATIIEGEPNGLSRGMKVEFTVKLTPVKQKKKVKRKPEKFQVEEGKSRDFYIKKGNHCLSTGDFEKAKSYFRYVLQDAPNDSMAINGMMRAEIGLRQQERQKRREKNQRWLLKYATKYEQMGDNAARAGKTDIALQYYQRILNITPNNARLLEKKANVLIAANRKKKAKETLKILLYYHPDRTDIKEKLDSLTPKPGETRTVTLPGGVSLKMVYIPAGTFMMGSPSSEKGRYSNEGPRHRVILTQGFWMGKYEVTQKQWKSIMDRVPSFFAGDNLPVEQVSWYDCQEFIQKLNQLTGKHFRLPTEAEWEYACRAGTNTAYYWGNKMDGSYCWYEGNSNDRTHPVGLKKPNAFGLYDMSGNVAEWCNDWFGHYPCNSVTDPRGPEFSSYRVIRGGSWFNDSIWCRSAFRSTSNPSRWNRYKGFRLVADEKEFK